MKLSGKAAVALAFVAGMLSLALLEHALQPRKIPQISLRLSGIDDRGRSFSVLINGSNTRWSCAKDKDLVVRGLVIYPEHSQSSTLVAHFRFFWGNSDSPIVIDESLPVAGDESSAQKVVVNPGLTASAFSSGI